jgi:hypothetical protein
MFDVQRSMFSLLEIRNRPAGDLRYRLREMRANKMRRIFLVGILCGVIMAAAVTFVFAIPANNDHWRIEITKRGGGDWYFDKNGHLSWMWTVEPIPDTRPAKRAIIVPSVQKNISHDRL